MRQELVSDLLNPQGGERLGYIPPPPRWAKPSLVWSQPASSVPRPCAPKGVHGGRNLQLVWKQGQAWRLDPNKPGWGREGRAGLERAGDRLRMKLGSQGLRHSLQPGVIKGEVGWGSASQGTPSVTDR